MPSPSVIFVPPLASVTSRNNVPAGHSRDHETNGGFSTPPERSALRPPPRLDGLPGQAEARARGDQKQEDRRAVGVRIQADADPRAPPAHERHGRERSVLDGGPPAQHPS